MAEKVKTVVIAEKPSVAADYARVLGCRNKKKGYYEGSRYLVTWALGHLVELAQPHDYDQKFKEWRLEHLPILPDDMRLKVIRKSSFQFNTVRALLKRSDVYQLIVATDAGREGELVARWIMRLSGWKKGCKRLWISSQTDAAIQAGFAGLKPGRDYEFLYQAAVCRAEADWLVGINISRALTCKYDFSLSAGRVQTPTLALIIDREKEIRSFQPRPFWTIHARFPGFTACWQGKQGSRIFSQNQAQSLQEKISGQTALIRDIKINRKNELPPLAYDLAELQRDANRLYSFPAQKTLQVLQGLYERHKLLTYPRTDSRYITSDMVPTLPARIKAMAVGPYQSLAAPLTGGSLNPGKRFVNNTGVSDHHAIIPTEQPLNISALSMEEKTIYDLVARRFLALLLPPCQVEERQIELQVGEHTFHAKDRRIREAGWRKAARKGDDKERMESEAATKIAMMPAKGVRIKVQEVSLKAGKTTPPPPYNEATLLSAMEHAGKFIEDEELQQSLKGAGLGTPATRAEIIEKIIRNRYVERRGRDLLPTDTGRQLVNLVPDELRSPELTAQWEKRLTGIATGQEQRTVFMTDIRAHAKKLVDMVKSSTAGFKIENLTRTPCPMCGKPMQKIKGSLACSDKRCGYEQSDPSGSPYETKRKSKKQKFQNRRLIEKYSDNRRKAGNSLGSLLETELKKKKN
jgi:DNA topoisomerase-3